MDLRAVLVDDEQLARDELGYLLGQIGGVEIIGQAGNGVEALTTIDRLHRACVFPGVQMPGVPGLEGARGPSGGVEMMGQAGKGVEALPTIDRLHPDVVFLDVPMPGLTGFEVARRM